MTLSRIEDILSAKPFNLDAPARAWVASTLESMSDAAKIRHLFIQICAGYGQEVADRMAELQPAGFARFFGENGQDELDLLDLARGKAPIPYLVSADLEGSRMSLPFGAEVPNPLGLAAIDDVETTREITGIMAREARAGGVSWSYTPVLDINAAFRSPIVATRGFGSDQDRICRHALAQIDVLQAHRVAATAKHWPGEGHDDRDQHLVTTVIPLSYEEWEASHGRLYRAAIESGVLSVMSAHIAFPAFVRSIDPDCGVEAFRPASISRLLNHVLLREKLGFNGLIVSDATSMAGLTSWGHRDDYLPELVTSGCDLILFSDEPEADIIRIEKALADGRLGWDRIEEALIRILGLKAAIGLHIDGKAPAKRSVLFDSADREKAYAAVLQTPTLVKDIGNILPLSPETHRRVLVYSTGIVLPTQEERDQFALLGMMAAEGFEVTVFDPDTRQEARNFDLVIYAMGEETLRNRGRIFLDWSRLAGQKDAMRRDWYDVPSVLLSFGYPYYLYDAPRMPCLVNSYSTSDSAQRATLDCLMGRSPFQGVSPVDPFCGREETRY